MALAEKTVTEMIELLEKGKPPSEVTRVLWQHAQTRMIFCDHKIERLKAKYGSFESLKDKILTGRHALQEERDFFNWEASVTELSRLKKLLGSKARN
ncbi:MAG: hypothetical protein ACYCPW_05410 [Nitrososphaerales archaeon]